MNVWIIVGIVSMLVVVGIAVVNAASNEVETEAIACETCGNSCSAESNCSRSTCGAVSGGTCGCGR